MRIKVTKHSRHRWGRWFAWFPVEVNPGDYRWLECVERRYCGFEDAWLYRAIIRYD